MNDVSVVIPCYNAARSLERAIRSVYSQKHVKEIIVVDDGSVDESPQILKKLKLEIPKLIVHLSPSNSGVSSARNLGLNLASGRFIAFLDADDFWMPNHIEISRHILSCENYTGVSNSCAVKLGDHKQLVPRLRNKLYKKSETFFLGNDIITSSFVGKRTCFETVRFANVKHEDLYCWYDLVKAGGVLYCSPEITIVRDVTHDGLSRNAFRSSSWFWVFLCRKLKSKPMRIVFFCIYLLRAIVKRIALVNRLKLVIMTWRHF